MCRICILNVSSHIILIKQKQKKNPVNIAAKKITNHPYLLFSVFFHLYQLLYRFLLVIFLIDFKPLGDLLANDFEIKSDVKDPHSLINH